MLRESICILKLDVVTTKVRADQIHLACSRFFEKTKQLNTIKGLFLNHTIF